MVDHGISLSSYHYFHLGNTAITYAGMRVNTQAPKLLKYGK